MNAEYRFFASCPKGLENLLYSEIEHLNAIDVRETVAGVYFDGDLEVAYRVCLWSRLANKVFLPLGKKTIKKADDIYSAAQQIPWVEHFKMGCSFIVDFIGTDDIVRHSQFGAQKVKDAIVDELRDFFGERPNVDFENPDLRINARLVKGQLHLSLDLSGESLHKRGYRVAQGVAPLKENLAAAILTRAGWPELAAKGGGLLDPMCGSGTFLIEGLMIAADIAPGLMRAESKRFGFSAWKCHEKDLWETLIADARERKKQGMAKPLPEIRGYDQDRRVLDAALANVETAGFDDYIRLTPKPVAAFKRPTHIHIPPGLMICNPPYGERLGEVEALREDYETLGRVAKAELPGWRLGVFTGNKSLAKTLRLRSSKRYRFYNGAIESELVLFELSEAGTLRVQPDEQPGELNPWAKNPQETVPVAYRDKPLSEGGQMVFNRLQKNLKKLKKWSQAEGITCYRLYDADMPEYAAAIDIYESYLHIQEYAAPKTIDKDKAESRFNDLVIAAAKVFDIADEKLFIKTRQKQKGKKQYDKLESSQSCVFSVQEGKSRLQVNLSDYLDTGIFLDHRPLRQKIHDMAAGKTFLNLFCYTATATVHAAVGGASSSVSVDMSNAYLDWAKTNFELNNIHPQRHELVRADCLNWLKTCRRGFDIIMLDPPTFSNSKKMEGVLDIQRDHVTLIKRCMELLKPDGVLFFSNNLRNFKIDRVALAQFNVCDISESTIDIDFKNNPRIHNCWEIRTGDGDSHG